MENYTSTSSIFVKLYGDFGHDQGRVRFQSVTAMVDHE